MRAGNLDRLITIQRKTVTQSPSGAPVETWADRAHRIFAGYRPLRGEERFTAAQEVAKEQVEFIVRNSPALADLSPLDRILYPAPAAADVQSPAAGTVFDILAAPEMGRDRGIRIAAERRTDV
jgi:head-tail adaptor